VTGHPEPEVKIFPRSKSPTTPGITLFADGARRLKRELLKRIFLGLCGLAVLLAAAFVFAWLHRRYREDSLASQWHREHGDSVKIAGHTLVLPAKWWQSLRDSDGTLIFRRALDNFLGDGPVLVMNPISQSEESTTDSEARELRQAWVSSLNKGTSAAVQSPASLLVINGPSLTFYCAKQVNPLKEIELYCSAAKFPYTLRATGPLWSENEIESVVSRLQ